MTDSLRAILTDWHDWRDSDLDQALQAITEWADRRFEGAIGEAEERDSNERRGFAKQVRNALRQEQRQRWYKTGEPQP